MLITGVCRGPSDQGGRERSALSDGAFWYQFFIGFFFSKKKNALDESESGRERSALSDGAFRYHFFFLSLLVSFFFQSTSLT